jgi:hypothetical protein
MQPRRAVAEGDKSGDITERPRDSNLKRLLPVSERKDSCGLRVAKTPTVTRYASPCGFFIPTPHPYDPNNEATRITKAKVAMKMIPTRSSRR